MIAPARLLAFLALAVALIGAGAGCQAFAAILSKTVVPFLPEEEVQAQYDLKGRSLLILVDAKDASLASDYPRLQSDLTDAIAKILIDQKACGPVVPSRNVNAARRTEARFNEWSVAQAGEYFNVDLVMHIEIIEFRLEDISGSSVFSGHAEAGIRLVDPITGEQVWPVVDVAKLMTGDTIPNLEAPQTNAREQILLEGFGEKLARLFYTYKTNDLPLRAKVK